MVSDHALRTCGYQDKIENVNLFKGLRITLLLKVMMMCKVPIFSRLCPFDGFLSFSSLSCRESSNTVGRVPVLDPYYYAYNCLLIFNRFF